MRIINVNIFPSSGGRFFIETDGTKIQGASWGQVVKATRSYRARNKLPAGDPEEEVRAQTCARDPSACHEVASPNEPPRQPTQPVPTSGDAQVRSRALRWLSDMKRHKGATGYPLGQVGNDEAARRAATCVACPMNGALGRGCTSCADVMAELRKNLAPGKNFDARLGGCQVLGADLQLAVFLNEPKIANSALPPACWRKAQ